MLYSSAVSIAETDAATVAAEGWGWVWAGSAHGGQPPVPRDEESSGRVGGQLHTLLNAVNTTDHPLENG